MACGTPVIATNVGGCAEVITQIEAGILMQEGSAEAIAEAVKHLQSNMPNQKDTRKYAERFSWAATSNAIQKLFQTIIHEK
jgi:glycosyltransferase involved in cell wall biosynthesis